MQFYAHLEVKLIELSDWVHVLFLSSVLKIKKNVYICKENIDRATRSRMQKSWGGVVLVRKGGPTPHFQLWGGDIFIKYWTEGQDPHGALRHAFPLFIPQAPHCFGLSCHHIMAAPQAKTICQRDTILGGRKKTL